MDKCSICNEWVFGSYHTCNPKYYVWIVSEGIDYAENGKTIFASNHEKAAIKYAESDWEFPDSEEVYVCLVSDYNCVCEKFLNEDLELSEEGMKELEKVCKIYCLESEVVRNFYAHKKEQLGDEC